MTDKRRTIGDLADAVGVGVETIRFYERRGLITQPRRENGGYRHYDDGVLAVVRYIRVAQQLGLSLKDVEEIKRSLGDQASFCSAVRATVDRKLAALTAQKAALTRLQGELEQFVQRCRNRPADLPCPILSELSQLDAAIAAPARHGGAGR